MKVKTLNELYVDELRDLYSAETQIVRALPKISKAVTTPELRKALEAHLEQTHGQIERLKTIFGELAEKPSGHTCKAMQGLLEEGDELIETVAEGPVRDAALIGACQKVEHYEGAGYGTAKTFATILGFKDHVKLLEETESEEFQADALLTQLAVEKVNDQAAAFERQTASTGKGK